MPVPLGRFLSPGYAQRVRRLIEAKRQTLDLLEPAVQRRTLEQARETSGFLQSAIRGAGRMAERGGRLQQQRLADSFAPGGLTQETYQREAFRGVRPEDTRRRIGGDIARQFFEAVPTEIQRGLLTRGLEGRLPPGLMEQLVYQPHVPAALKEQARAGQEIAPFRGGGIDISPRGLFEDVTTAYERARQIEEPAARYVGKSVLETFGVPGTNLNLTRVPHATGVATELARPTNWVPVPVLDPLVAKVAGIVLPKAARLAPEGLRLLVKKVGQRLGEATLPRAERVALEQFRREGSDTLARVGLESARGAPLEGGVRRPAEAPVHPIRAEYEAQRATEAAIPGRAPGAAQLLQYPPPDRPGLYPTKARAHPKTGQPYTTPAWRAYGDFNEGGRYYARTRELAQKYADNMAAADAPERLGLRIEETQVQFQNPLFTKDKLTAARRLMDNDPAMERRLLRITGSEDWEDLAQLPTGELAMDLAFDPKGQRELERAIAASARRQGYDGIVFTDLDEMVALRRSAVGPAPIPERAPGAAREAGDFITVYRGVLGDPEAETEVGRWFTTDWEVALSHAHGDPEGVYTLRLPRSEIDPSTGPAVGDLHQVSPDIDRVIGSEEYGEFLVPERLAKQATIAPAPAREAVPEAAPGGAEEFYKTHWVERRGANMVALGPEGEVGRAPFMRDVPEMRQHQELLSEAYAMSQRPAPPQMGERPPPQFGTTQREFMGEQGGLQGRMFTPEETGQVGQIGLEDVVTGKPASPFADDIRERRVLRDEMDRVLTDSATRRVKGKTAEAKALRDQYDLQIRYLESATERESLLDTLAREANDLYDKRVQNEISSRTDFWRPAYGTAEYSEWEFARRGRGKPPSRATGMLTTKIDNDLEAIMDLADRQGEPLEQFRARMSRLDPEAQPSQLEERIDTRSQELTTAGLDEETARAAAELEAMGVPPMGGGNSLQRLTELIRAAKPIRAQTEALKRAELRRRAGALAGTIEGAQGREGLPKALSQLKGQLPRAAFEPPESLLKSEEIDDLFRMIWRSESRPFTKVNTASALEKLLTGQIPTRGEIKLLETQFGKELAQAILSKRSLGTRAWENFMDAVNLPRAFMSAWDASAPLRQGIVLTIGHPKESLPAMATMFKAMASEKFARHVDDAIRAGPNFDLMDDAGLYVAPWDSAAATLSSREETFMSALADRIPGIKQSQQGFVTYLNKLRADVADTVIKNWEGTSKTTDDYKSLARFLNHATGRGDLGPLREMGPIINAVFFSPRLLLSRVQLPLDVFTSTPAVRKLVARDLLAFVGTGTTILAMLKLSGAADVELDPRSTDFGKMRMGKQRIDFWGGFQPIARYTAQVLTGQRKTGAGDIVGTARGDVIARFLRSKLAPIPGLAETFRSGKTYAGQAVELSAGDIKGQAFNTLVPLFIQDLIESAQQEGMIGLARAVPGGLGANVLAYQTDLEKAQEIWNETHRDTTGKPLPWNRQVAAADPAIAPLLKPSEERVQRDVLAAENLPTGFAKYAAGVLRGDSDFGPKLLDAYSDFKLLRRGINLAQFQDFDFPESGSDAERAMQAVYDVDAEKYVDAETGEFDYDGLKAEQDRLLNTAERLNPGFRDVYENALVLPPEYQDVERQLKNAKRLRDDLADIPKYRNFTLEDLQTVTDFRRVALAAREDAKKRRGSANVPETAVFLARYGRAAGMSNEVIAQAINLGRSTWTKANINPEYLAFLINNRESLLLFYPDLETDQVSDIIRALESRRAAE